MKSLNYSVPLINVIPTTLYNATQVVSVLPRTSYDKLILGHFTYLGNLTNSDVVDLTQITPWGYVSFGADMYVETIDKNKAVWRDDGTYTGVANYWYLYPIYVQPNTQILMHYSNIKASGVNQIRTLFYVARSVVYS